jgi:hypothetical protein
MLFPLNLTLNGMEAFPPAIARFIPPTDSGAPQQSDHFFWGDGQSISEAAVARVVWPRGTGVPPGVGVIGRRRNRLWTVLIPDCFSCPFGA